MSQIKTKFITDKAVTNAKLADVPTSTFKGRSSAGAGVPEDLTAAQALVILNDPSSFAGYREDFLFGNGIGSFANASSGAGSAFAGAGTLVSGNRWGVVAASTGTATTGRGSGSSAIMELGASHLTFEAAVYIPDLSTLTEEYIMDIGIHDQATVSAAMGQGFQFVYDRLTSTNWLAKTATGASTTTTTTGTTVGEDTWYSFKIIQYSDNSKVEFYINGTLVATNTTNVPAGGVNSRPAIRIVKSAGTTSRAVHCDYISYLGQFNAPR